MVDLVVKNKIKEVLPKELRISSDLADALNKKIEQMIKGAAERARANKRTTVMAQDL